jgi:hypothetical protein
MQLELAEAQGFAQLLLHAVAIIGRMRCSGLKKCRPRASSSRRRYMALSACCSNSVAERECGPNKVAPILASSIALLLPSW